MGTEIKQQKEKHTDNEVKEEEIKSQAHFEILIFVTDTSQLYCMLYD